MEVSYIRPFDSWIDGGLSIAKKIVNVFRNSKKFTLTEYPGQDDFYEEYLSKYDGYTDVLYGLSDKEYWLLPLVKQELVALSELGLLTFAHFTVAYYQVLYHIDQARGLEASQGSFLPILTENYKEEIDAYVTSNQNIVPFTSQTGAFGFNTFLYLWYNGLFPVACAVDPYPVHAGLFPSSTSTMFHDYAHFLTMRKQNAEKLEGVYWNILYKVEKGLISTDKAKLLILLIFRYVHETVRNFDCSNKRGQSASLDEIPFLLRLAEFSPERYGLSKNLLESGTTVEKAIEGYRFSKAVFNDAEQILCEEFLEM